MASLARTGASGLRMEIDLGSKQAQFGHLRVPHPTNRSAYGWVGLPVYCFNFGNGPTVTFLGGVHGDEREGQLVLPELADWLFSQDIRGRIIIVPQANVLACRAGSRFSPSDGLNLNREFPGNAAGTYTQRLASVLHRRVLAISDYLIDMHSGGESLRYMPSLVLHESQTDDERIRRLIEFTAFEQTLIFEFDIDSSSILAAISGHGGCAIAMELGGGGALDANGINLALTSARSILAGLGVISPSASPLGPLERKFLYVDRKRDFMYASHEGVLVSLKKLGAKVTPGEVVCRLYEKRGAMHERHELTHEHGGVIVCWRAIPTTDVGDCLLHMAQERPDRSFGNPAAIRKQAV